MKTIRRARALLLAGVLAFAVTAPPATANANDAAYGVGSALTSLVYSPTKIVYAVLGTVFGGLGWVFSAGDNEVASRVITPAVYGDYVVTPSVLKGEDKLEFIGQGPGGYEPPAASVAEGPRDDTYGQQDSYSQGW